MLDRCLLLSDIVQLGDTDPLGIIITFAYLVATLLCGWASISAWRGKCGDAVFWTLMTVLYLGLGINKQADLQIFITEELRQLAREQGWYPRRREYQFIATGLIAAVAACSTLALVWRSLRQHWTHSIAAIAVGLQATYVCVRVVSLHHVDEWLSISLGRETWQYVELCGALMCAAAALGSITRRHGAGTPT